MKTKIMNLFRTIGKSGEMGKSLKSLKSLMQIFATFASAIFVGKESNESTVRYALWSRISLIKPLQNPYLTLTRFRLSLGSNLSRISLASLICLCMLTVGVGNVWGESASATFRSDGKYSTTITTAGSAITVVASSSDLAGWNSGAPGWSCGSATNTFSFTISTLSTKYITSVSVTAKRTKSKTITASVTVGGNDYGGDAQISEASTSYRTFEFEDAVGVTGDIVITLTSPGGSQKADKGTLMLSDITIEYEDSPVTPSCSNNVTPAEGTKTNVSAMTFSSASVATCSETAADRQVTVTITPSSCYSVPSSTRLSVTGTSADYVSGPTDNGNGTYSFVYRFAKDATGTSTFSASLSTKTTYTVQYNAGATTCTGGNAITGSHADDTKTCGTNLTLPGETFHATGYTQTGWTKSSCGSQTNGLGGSYTSNAEQTFYPVWTVNSYTVTWMVNGEEYTAGGSTSVNYGSHVATLPTAPTPSCGDKFMGWTTTNIGSVGQATDAGLNLFTTAGGAPTISAEGDVTYYAVFADEE